MHPHPGSGERWAGSVGIDRDECSQCAACWEICSEVFEKALDDALSQFMQDTGAMATRHAGRCREN